MAIKKPAAHAGGLADVAVAAGCVTASAVIAKHLMHGRILGVRPPGFHDSPVTGLRGMQAVGLQFDLLLMTFRANRIFAEARSGNDILMGSFFQGILLTAMALNARQLAMISFRKALPVD